MWNEIEMCHTIVSWAKFVAQMTLCFGACAPMSEKNKRLKRERLLTNPFETKINKNCSSRVINIYMSYSCNSERKRGNIVSEIYWIYSTRIDVALFAERRRWERWRRQKCMWIKFRTLKEINEKCVETIWMDLCCVSFRADDNGHTDLTNNLHWIRRMAGLYIYDIQTVSIYGMFRAHWSTATDRMYM